MIDIGASADWITLLCVDNININATGDATYTAESLALILYNIFRSGRSTMTWGGYAV